MPTVVQREWFKTRHWMVQWEICFLVYTCTLLQQDTEAALIQHALSLLPALHSSTGKTLLLSTVFSFSLSPLSEQLGCNFILDIISWKSKWYQNKCVCVFLGLLWEIFFFMYRQMRHVTSTVCIGRYSLIKLEQLHVCLCCLLCCLTSYCSVANSANKIVYTLKNNCGSHKLAHCKSSCLWNVFSELKD